MMDFVASLLQFMATPGRVIRIIEHPTGTEPAEVAVLREYLGLDVNPLVTGVGMKDSGDVNNEAEYLEKLYGGDFVTITGANPYANGVDIVPPDFTKPPTGDDRFMAWQRGLMGWMDALEAHAKTGLQLHWLKEARQSFSNGFGEIQWSLMPDPRADHAPDKG